MYRKLIPTWMGFGWLVAFWHAGWKCKEDYGNNFRCSIPRIWMQCSDFSDRRTPGWSTLKNGLWLTVLRSPRDGGRSTLCHDLSEKTPERSKSDAPDGAIRFLPGVTSGAAGWSCSPWCAGKPRMWWILTALKGIAVSMKHVKMITIKSYQNYQI